MQADDFLDLRSVVRNSGEQGLLGLAFAPDHATSGRVFVNFINTDGHTVIARFTRMSGDPLRGDPASRFDLRWPDGQRVISQPFANHNGGNLAFGPDGFLYIGMGDGGSGNDPAHRAQNPQTLLGKMLRIDVSVSDADPEGYNVPPTNPFAGRQRRARRNLELRPQEPVALELRHSAARRHRRARPRRRRPKRLGRSELRAGGPRRAQLWMAQPRGRAQQRDESSAVFQPLIDPIYEYPSSVGNAITGGFVYRGTALGSSFRGRYFFGDFVTSRVWSIRLTVNASTGEATASDLVEHTADFGAGAASPSSFGVDAAGEIYIVNYTGRIHRITGDGDEPPPAPGAGSGSGARTPSPDAVITGTRDTLAPVIRHGLVQQRPPCTWRAGCVIQATDAVLGDVLCDVPAPATPDAVDLATWLRARLDDCGIEQPLDVRITIHGSRSMTLTRVCVFAGSLTGIRASYSGAAETLGRLLAERQIELVYGGGRVGLMGVLANAVLAGGGRVTGVIPRALATREIAHDGLTDLRVVTTMHERKALMEDLSDGFIALPGGWGTLEEFFEVLTWAQLGIHGKPCGLLNADGYFDPLLAFLGHVIDEGFVRPEYASMIPVSHEPGHLLDQMTRYQPPVIEKWLDETLT